jgi:carboxyl-terminal processing protease
VRRIRGEAGTTVTLNVLREGQEPREIKIVREVITLASVETEILDGNIGYLKLTRFSDDTEGLVDAAIKDFKAKNVKGVILDLRGNPGGYLDTAVSLSENWLKPGQVILEEKRDGRVIQQFAAKAEGPLNGVKTVVLIDGGSASASEITAGALKDNKVATLVGAKTFGKGSVQEPLTLGTGGILKVTVARWFTPGGQNIDKEGIKPDIEVKLDEEKLKKEIDTQLEAAKKQLLQ